MFDLQIIGSTEFNTVCLFSFFPACSGSVFDYICVSRRKVHLFSGVTVKTEARTSARKEMIMAECKCEQTKRF